MQTFDLLIIAMGIELVRLHGRDSVYILTADSRMVNILRRTENISKATVRTLDLDKAARLAGLSRFRPALFPKAFNLSKGTETGFQQLFQETQLSDSKRNLGLA